MIMEWSLLPGVKSLTNDLGTDMSRYFSRRNVNI